MKPIVGTTNHPDISQAEMYRHLHEAKRMRAQATRAMIANAFGYLFAAVNTLLDAVRRTGAAHKPA